jgi:hypothetical protein
MHALLLEGSYEWALTFLPLEYRTEGADVVHYRGLRMGIDEVRTLIQEAYLTPMNAVERVFILAYPDFTREAQNALLKLLEEPPTTARFYVITNRAGNLLETVRSRLVYGGNEEQTFHAREYEDFLRLSYAERLEHIATHIQKKDDVWITSLMRALGVWAHLHADATFMKSFLELQSFFYTPGASKKMILEHLALLLPSHTHAD